MISADFVPSCDAARLLALSNPVLEAQLVYTALEIDLFTALGEGKTAVDLANHLHLNTRNTELLLDALTACGYLRKQRGRYDCLAEASCFLKKDGELYLGDQILYWRDMTDLSDLTRLVREGADLDGVHDRNGSDFFDFRAMGRGAKNAMYTGRVQRFLADVCGLFQKEDAFSVLDLGCGSGIFSIEIARCFPRASVTLFDQPRVIAMTQENLWEYGVSDRCTAIAGNFVTDDFGGPYDLIIASGIMDFVGDLSMMAKRLHAATSEGGFLFVSTHGITDDFTGPKPTILGWLSSRLHGLDILKTHSEIHAAILQSGFAERPEGQDPFSLFFTKASSNAC